MAVEVIYQKRDLGTFEKNFQRTIFVDEKHLEEIEAKVEYNLEIVLKEIQEFVSKFYQLSKEWNLGNEIKSAEDFFNAKYLQEPDYNFHEKALQLRKLLNILISNFISDILFIIKKIEEHRPKSEAEINLEIAKIKRLEAIAKRLTSGAFKLLEPRLKSWTEFGLKTKEEFSRSEEYARLMTQYENEKKAFEKKLKAKAEEFGESIADSEDAIKELRKISEEITRGDAKQHGYTVSKRLGFLALRNADTDKKTIILRESALEEEVLRLLKEFEDSKQLIEQQYNDSIIKNDSQFRVKLLERISWLRRAILNLLDLYVQDITMSVNVEVVLEREEIQSLYKIKAYLHILSQLPILFREIFQVNHYIGKLSGLAINVSLYSRESLKWEIFGGEELEWLSGELRRLDYLFSAHEDLTSKINPEKQPEISREKLIDIIPREVRVQGAAGTVISGDLYLKDVNYRPKIGIIALHGVNDSRRVYYSLAVRAANMGFLVYCPDLPSHGHPSEGTFKFGATSESMLLVIKHLKEKYGLEKIGVIAWSLGSMVALFTLMHYTVAIEEHLERLNMYELKNNKTESEENKNETTSLIKSEYFKYKDCGIDALLILTPVDYTQMAFPVLKWFYKGLGKWWFPPIVKASLLFTYREGLRAFIEGKPDKDNPPGTRFYFKKNPNIKAVKDSDKSDGFYRRLMNRLKLGKIEDPLQTRAQKTWKEDALRYVLLTPNQILYFRLLLGLCPEIVAEIRKVPKVAIYGENDTLVGMRKRGLDLIKLFEGFGNMKTVVLKEMGHDLDYNGDGHNLYIEPVLIKYFYDFFLLVAQQ